MLSSGVAHVGTSQCDCQWLDYHAASLIEADLGKNAKFQGPAEAKAMFQVL